MRADLTKVRQVLFSLLKQCQQVYRKGYRAVGGRRATFQSARGLEGCRTPKPGGMPTAFEPREAS
jgi:hypothetical protein